MENTHKFDWSRYIKGKNKKIKFVLNKKLKIFIYYLNNLSSTLIEECLSNNDFILKYNFYLFHKTLFYLMQVTSYIPTNLCPN